MEWAIFLRLAFTFRSHTVLILFENGDSVMSWYSHKKG